MQQKVANLRIGEQLMKASIQLTMIKSRVLQRHFEHRRASCTILGIRGEGRKPVSFSKTRRQYESNSNTRRSHKPRCHATGRRRGEGEISEGGGGGRQGERGGLVYTVPRIRNIGRYQVQFTAYTGPS